MMRLLLSLLLTLAPTAAAAQVSKTWVVRVTTLTGRTCQPNVVYNLTATDGAYSPGLYRGNGSGACVTAGGPGYVLTGSGSPEGAQTAAVGTLYSDTAADGELWRKKSGSGNTGWETVTRNPKTTAYVEDEFLGGTTTSTTIGDLGWSLGGGGTAAVTASAASHPGIRTIATTASASNVTYLTFQAATSNIRTDYLFDFIVILRLDHADSDTTFRFGLADGPTTTPTNGVYVEKLAADTEFFGVNRVGGASTRTAALRTATAAEWVKLRVRRINSTTVGFAINDGTEVTLASTVAVVGYAFLHVGTGAASSKSFALDYASFAVTGMTRY